MNKTDALEALTVSLLCHEDRYLLLQRSPRKSFAPGRWTGLGGHVEANEYSQLRSAALREVEEEAGLVAAEISHFTLRRALLVSRPWQPVRVLFYFTGLLSHIVTPNCPEGTLFWKRELEFDALDIIETTRPVLSLLIQDMKTDPEGTALPVMGMAVFDAQGTFQHVIWAT